MPPLLKLVASWVVHAVMLIQVQCGMQGRFTSQVAPDNPGSCLLAQSHVRFGTESPEESFVTGTVEMS